MAAARELDATQLPRRIVGPTEDSLAAIAETIPRVAPSNGELVEWYDTGARTHAKRFAVDLDLISLVDPDATARVLDIGSIPPVFLTAMKARHRDACGVDIAPDRFRDTIERLELRIAQCNIETEPLPFADSSFEIVFLSEVFEHLRINLIWTMREIARVLSRGGLLFLSTPNGRSLRGLQNFVLYGKGGWCGAADIYAQYSKLERLGHMGHVREYTPRDLTRFLDQLGLQVVHIVWRGVDGGRLHRHIDRVVPSLSPVMTLVARKHGDTGPEAPA